MSTVTIYHNPACGTSRNTLALIRSKNIEPDIIEYMKTPLSKTQLKSLISSMHISTRELLRDQESAYRDLNLADKKWSDDELVDFMIENPSLMNRPIVVSPTGTRLCRPAETVLGILG